MRRPPLTLTAAALAAGLLLAGCGDDDHGGDDHGASTPVAEDARRVEVIARNFEFEPSEITAEVGEDLAIVLTSEDSLHDFTIDELDSHVSVRRGETAEGGLHAEEAGTYTFYCSVPGHQRAGMEGTLVVR